jgi:light-regulated signal transduction histidine kinase (bacteriophytochrome)
VRPTELIESTVESVRALMERIGIAPEALARIFEMFSQQQGGSERSEGGLGVGLALIAAGQEPRLHGATPSGT